MSTQATNRKPSLDIIRGLALLTVAGVHFFLHSDYYNTPIVGGKMYAFTLIRQFCMICVPLFIILSGYLMSKHTVSAKFYKKIIYILSIYFMASVCCTLFKVLYQNEQFNLIKFVQKILNFSAAPYSWYVEMYIGLFLLCPFLNSAYNNLKSKKEKTVLILTMLFLSALPQTTVELYISRFDRSIPYAAAPSPRNILQIFRQNLATSMPDNRRSLPIYLPVKPC